MKVLNLLLAAIGIGAAIITALTWFAGGEPNIGTWLLAICGALYSSGGALQRAFPSLKQ